MNRNLAIVFSIFLLVGIIVPVYAQTISDNVVINEVDINPPLNDALGISEWAELYNPTDSDVSLAGWEIASTTVLKKIKTISPGTIIKPGHFLTFYHENSWFTDFNEVIELRDANGIVIDKTPALTDTTNDFKSWQLIYDGYSSDNIDDWKFVPPTPGSSNGKLIETQDDDEIFVTVTSDKSSYLMNDNAIIAGSVSEEVYLYKPFFAQATINVIISGPNYYKTLTLYPDRDLNFATTLKLQQVLGANEGIYDVSVDYAGATANTSFSVGFELIALEQKDDVEISIITDKSQYIPGDTVTIVSSTTEVIPFEPMKFTVKNNADTVTHTGTFFPSLDRKAPTSASTTTIYIDNVNPNYGNYVIDAEYFGKSVSTTFEVLEDIKEDVPISLWTDKVAYGLGEEVKITGRLNQNYVSTLDLLIDQTKQTSTRVDKSPSQNMFRHSGGVTVLGDFTFSHTFKIPDSENRLGDYRIDVRKNIGSATVIIHVMEDPESFVNPTEQLTLVSDKAVYQIGDTIRLSGFILEQYENKSYQTGGDVGITFTTEDGRSLEIVALPKGAKTRSNDGVVVGYHFTAIPERSGSFTTLIKVTQGAVPEGKYTATATYFGDSASTTILVSDDLAGINLADGTADISFDKEVYGLKETVYLTGIIPPTGDTSVKIFLTRPDGTSTIYGATIDNQRFSWSWNTPIAEKTQFLTSDDVRFERESNFGLYKVRLSTDTLSTNVYFKVSTDPENDSISTIPLFVSTDKSLYKAGEKLQVTGSVTAREQGNEGLVVPERVAIRVLDGTFPYKPIPGFTSTVYPNQGGYFSTAFEFIK